MLLKIGNKSIEITSIECNKNFVTGTRLNFFIEENSEKK